MTAHLQKLKWAGGCWTCHFIIITDDGAECGGFFFDYQDGQGPLKVRFRLPERAE